jgi:subtilisin family serine protease
MVLEWKRTIVMLAAVLASSVMVQTGSAGTDRLQRFIIVFQDAPLASFAGGQPPSASLLADEERYEATSPSVTKARKLDVRSPRSRSYRRYLDKTHDAFRLEARVSLGRAIQPRKVYYNALNGMALDLTPAEAKALAQSPYVKSIRKDKRHRLETDAGPEWIGAGQIWNGDSGFPAIRGEGVVIGMIDSGINWDHPSFADPANDGYDHVNPFGSQLGLCSKAEVMCNDKLAGIYDFVEDDPDTTDVVEENTDGKDNAGHGSHVTATAAGNVLTVTLNGSVSTPLSGVAPHANIVAYRVCFIGDPPDPQGGGCMASAILAAIEQAIEDGVDVINYSIGTDASDPWIPGDISMAFLNARNAGIYVVTSGGNEGPNAGTIGAPANAPWVIAAGNATHNRIFASVVQNLSGGATPAPGDLVGASLGGGIAARKIVHARDFGFALCGTGDAELGASCEDNQGVSNPWNGPKPFNGEIVVCDRGTYGRIEKGKNVMLAGAGGYILANTAAEGEPIVSDAHCLPASHIGAQDGNQLRTWLASGSNHMGSISGFTLAKDSKYADQVSSSSSRGPVLSPVQNTLKPNVITPGTSILAASDVGSEFLVLSGTSMASPHVAGSAALLLAVHPDWNVAQIASALETTATAALARDSDGSIATPHERGGGRPRLGEAVNAGLYLDVTGAQFTSANPAIGGDPKNLNLTGLVDTACQGSCNFNRTVSDQMGGGNWTATGVNFPAGVSVKITPANFTLTNGGSRSLNIEIDLEASAIVGEWVYGDILLTAAGSSDQALTVAVFSSGGNLPEVWTITDDRDTGWTEFNLSGLVALPDATLTSGGLVAPTKTTKTLEQDPTNSDPFDGGAGVFTVWHDLPQGGLWLHAETLASTAADLDLFVGRDDNEDGIADADEQLCESTSPDDVENCEIFNLPAGNYWVVVQNWEGTQANGDAATLVSAAIDGSDQSTLVASGSGINDGSEAFTVRTSWSNINALSGQQWLGAVGIGTKRGSPNNIGVIPVRFNRNGYAAPQTLPLMNGTSHKLALAGNATNQRLFIDIPPGVTSLNIAAQGASSTQSNALSMELFRQDFSAALSSPPFAQLPGGLAAAGSASGSGGNGPSITLSGPVAQGRYFVRLRNNSADAAAVSIMATVTSAASSLDPHRGLWDFDRNISQGAEWNSAGAVAFTIWYTYDDAGQPTWYIASAPAVSGNIWTADLLRVTNDGGQQQENKVGELAITFIANNKLIYSYTLLGQSGFDSMHPNGPNTCPVISGGPKSYTGHWYRGVAGLGGSTVLAYADAEAQLHYIYDAKGEPRWLLAAHDNEPAVIPGVLQLLQFSGFCAVCTPVDVSFSNVGDISFSFGSQTSGNWTLDFGLDAPLVQSINRSDSIVKLSDTLSCD